MFEWAYLIPLAPFIVGGLAIWTRHQHKMAEMQLNATAQNTAEKAAQYASRVGDLEDRVRILERIVTDKGYDVATQIEALRDQHSVESHGSGTPLDIKQGEKA